MSNKRKLVVVILAIVIYFGLSYCYQTMVINKKYKEVYVVSKEVKRGEAVTEEKLEKLKIEDIGQSQYLTHLDKEYVFNNVYPAGVLLQNNMMLAKEEYLEIQDELETVAIKLDFAEDAVAYQIESGNIVHVYCSAKRVDVQNILATITEETILSNDTDSSYVTFRFLTSVTIVNCYDKYGNQLLQGQAPNSELLDTIMIRISKKDSMLLSNLKNYGKFSLSIVK